MAGSPRISTREEEERKKEDKERKGENQFQP